jgi:hypothetical protein
VLLGATWAHAGNGWLFTSPNGGWEYPAFWTVALVIQALLGDGAYALRTSPRSRCSAHSFTFQLRGHSYEALLLPGACSLAPHIGLEEAGVAYDSVKVDLKKHTTADGGDYYAINPKGYVPLLELDDGSLLSEAGVILQYIADRKPGTIAPAFGTMERYRVMEWLNFIATELHKQFSPLWYPTTPDATKDASAISSRSDSGISSRRLASSPI